MSKGYRDAIVFIDRQMAELGIETYRIEDTRGGHKRIVVTEGAVERFVVFASTPSDRRSALNLCRDIRKVVKEMRS